MSEAVPREGEVELLGEVRAADLDARVFALRLADGETVQGRFTPDQEAAITEALHQHASRRLRVRGRAELTRVRGKVRRTVTIDEATVEEPPIWETLLEISASVPESEWANVPTDLARNLDHYLSPLQPGGIHDPPDVG